VGQRESEGEIVLRGPTGYLCSREVTPWHLKLEREEKITLTSVRQSNKIAFFTKARFKYLRGMLSELSQGEKIE